LQSQFTPEVPLAKIETGPFSGGSNIFLKMVERRGTKQQPVQAAPAPSGGSAVSKALMLPFLVCCAPALTALWMSGILWFILKSWR
jgi:hypothetical protein